MTAFRSSDSGKNWFSKYGAFSVWMLPSAFEFADVGHALEELALDEELAVAVDLLEQRDRLVEVTVATLPVVVTAEEEQQLVLHRRQARIVEGLRVVRSDLLEDAGRLGQH